MPVKRIPYLQGSGLIRIAQAVLDNDEIKALPITAIEIIAAPGPHKIIFPIAAFLYLDWTADYSNINAASFLHLLNAGLTSILSSGIETTINSVTGLFALGETAFLSAAIQQGVVPPNIGANIGALADIINGNLQLKMNNRGDGPMTGGDAGNTLTVTIIHTLLDIN
jgi:hypothetical protein